MQTWCGSVQVHVGCYNDKCQECVGKLKFVRDTGDTRLTGLDAQRIIS